MIGTTTDFARRLRRWYRQHRRDLPWRLPLDHNGKTSLNPYHVLVSETMLQQTQVATVIPYFHRFIELFPTVRALAIADEQQVLRAWQGLGYYSRARNLHAAAKQIVTAFGGEVPATIDQLLGLPGVGRYTAGAVASIGFEQRAPILDGNVARVLCRIDGLRGDPREPATRQRLWARAGQLLPRTKVGDFNSALMELGALICTPRSPGCPICPVRRNCQAHELGLAGSIPPPRAARPIPLLRRWTFCVRDGDRYLVEQRPAKGRWPGMWQFATAEAVRGAPSAEVLRLQYSLRTSAPISIGRVTHALTHRRYEFEAFCCENLGQRRGEWATLGELDNRPMPRPQLKIREMLERRGSEW